MPVEIPSESLEKIRIQSERDYPHETCGILVGPRSAPGQVTALYPCRNVQDVYHAEDPVNFPRDSRTAYFIDPRDLFRIQKETRHKGWEIRVIYHSHVDAGAYFSEEDERIALSEGKPAYPGVSYLVVSVKEGRAEEASLFEWNEEQKRFLKSTAISFKGRATR